jgi:hypothetical protein
LWAEKALGWFVVSALAVSSRYAVRRSINVKPISRLVSRNANFTGNFIFWNSFEESEGVR